MKQTWITISIFLLSLSQLHAQTDTVLANTIRQIQSGEYFSALQTLGNYVKANPKNADGFYWRGYTYVQLEQFSQAEANLLAALKINAQYHEALAALGYVYTQMRKYPEAIKAYDNAISLCVTNPEYFNNRGKVKYFLQKFQAAFFDFDAAIRLDSNFAVAYSNRGSARYNNNNIEKATFDDLSKTEADFSKCIQLQPAFQMAWRNRGVVRLHLGNFNQAYKDLKLAVQMAPADAIAHYQLGRVLHKLEQHQLALVSFDRALQINSRMGDVFFDRGETYFSISEYDKAIRDYETFISLVPAQKGKALYRIARIHAQQQNKALMMQYLKQAQKSKYFDALANRQALKTDIAFDNYRNDSDFRKWISGVMKVK
jgi:tetratricopeptide (TPR) repeat protein